MTSLSVRQYILGVMKAHGLNERDVTKFQTGGPDGDLGSSKSSHDILVISRLIR
jgi:glutamate dehydrogenase